MLRNSKYKCTLFNNGQHENEKVAIAQNIGDSITFIADSMEDYRNMLKTIAFFENPYKPADSFSKKIDVKHTCEEGKKQISVYGRDRWQVLRSFFYKGFLNIKQKEYDETISSIKTMPT